MTVIHAHQENLSLEAVHTWFLVFKNILIWESTDSPCSQGVPELTKFDNASHGIFWIMIITKRWFSR